MMLRKGQMDLVTVVTLVILGVGIGLPLLAQLVSEQTDTFSATNESINITNNSVQTVANTGVVSATDVITNGTGVVTLTRDSNYTIDYGDSTTEATVTFTNVNNTETGVDGLISYDHRSASFADSALTRTIITFIVVAFAYYLIRFFL